MKGRNEEKKRILPLTYNIKRGEKKVFTTAKNELLTINL